MMATSKTSFVPLEQEIDEDTLTAARRKSNNKWKLITVAILFLLFLISTCIIIILFTQTNVKNSNKTNTSIVINQRVVSTSLNSKIMVSKYSNYVIHKELTDNTNHRRLLTLNDEYDYAWVGGIYVSIDGSDTFTSIPVVFDSGSSNFWITSNKFCVDCSTCTNPSYQTVNRCQDFDDDKFTASDPTTGIAINATIVDEQIDIWQQDGQNKIDGYNTADQSIEFINGGAWTGTATDTYCSDENWIFCIQYEHGKTEGIYTKTKFTNNQEGTNAVDGWISVAYVDTTGVSYHANGVFGLGFTDLSIGVDPPLKQMVDANLATYNYFYMHFEPSNGGDSVGYINFGGKTLEHGTFDGTFDVTPDAKYFEIAMESIIVNDEDIKTTSTTALLDTGTSFIIGPQDDVIKMINKMNSSDSVNIIYNNDYGLYIIDCNSQNDLPNIGIKMINQNGYYYVTPQLYVFTHNTISGKCIIGVKPLDDPHDLNGAWILGDVYLKTIGCVQFDVTNRKILYSQASAGCQVESTQIQ
eukprot:164179_1